MKRKIEVLNPKQLVKNLKQWKEKNENACQLDGSLERCSNREPFCAVTYNEQRFYLAMDTTREGVELFLSTAERVGNPHKALLLSSTKDNTPCLRINTGRDKADGFYCYARAITNKETYEDAA